MKQSQFTNKTDNVIDIQNISKLYKKIHKLEEENKQLKIDNLRLNYKLEAITKKHQNES